MLVELCIRDLALIDNAELSFGPGLNVITGQTGSGKSLLVGALELLLGDRPRGEASGYVRTDCKRALVEGRFLVPAGERARSVHGWLVENLPALVEDEFTDSEVGAELELVLSRTIGADGRTRAHVDQRPISLRALKSLAPILFEIHGQNDHQKLLESPEQLRLADAFGGLEPQVEAYRERRAAWLELTERCQRLDAERSERRDRLELLRFQAAELEDAGLEAGERARLVEERALLRNAGELRAELEGWLQRLSEGEDTALDALRGADNAVTRWRADLPALDELGEDLRAAVVHLEESASALASFTSGVEVDPVRLEHAEARLALIEELERKYETDEQGLLARCAGLSDEVVALEEEEGDAKNWLHELARARGALADRAAELTRARRKLEKELSCAVREALDELGLGGARFELSVTPRAAAGFEEGNPEPEADRKRFGPTGADHVEFLLAANPGESERPLRHVASGGEAARIMLALRGVLAACESGRTLVFDEVDAGVGGRLGPRVGKHLAKLAGHHQVLCVTHLPAIAAQADQHLRVAKSTTKGRTHASVEELTGELRESEIADMIAGGGEEATARAEARRLLSEAGSGAR